MSKRTDPKEDPRQRKLGAITPEVVNSLLPERTETAPTSVAEFDGWDAAKVSAWLTGMAHSFRQARSVVGLGLWVLRDRLETEADYLAFAVPIAEAYDVSNDTLTRWRRAAQTELGLPNPAGAKGKSKAGRAGRAAQSSEKDDSESGAPNAPLSGQPIEESEPEIAAEPDISTPSDQQEQVQSGPEPADEQRSSAPATPASTPDTQSEPPAPPPPPPPPQPEAVRKPLEEQVHDLIDKFLQSSPEKVAALDATNPKLAASRAESLGDWALRYHKAARKLAAKGSKDPAKCQHPQSAHEKITGGMVKCRVCGEKAWSGVSLSRMGEQVG